MANKKTELSVVIRAFDKATAPIRAINAKVRAMTSRLSEVGKAAGIGAGLGAAVKGIAGAFSMVGSAIGSVLKAIPVLGAVIAGLVGGAVAGLMKLVDHFDDLGDKAEAMGVSVDFLAQMRYAAERSGASVESLDSGLKSFTTSLGQARAGTGRMLAFIQKVSPALAKQLKGAKSNEAAFDLLANAMIKLKDPAKRAALAQKTFGDASLAPLLNRGAAGLKELRDRYFQLAGSQKGAARKAGEVDDAMKDFKASVDGVKAALVVGLAPALKVVIQRLGTWFTAHREDIQKWAVSIGEKIPGAIQATVAWLDVAITKVTKFVEEIGKIADKLGGIQKIVGDVWKTAKSGPLGELFNLAEDLPGAGWGNDEPKGKQRLPSDIAMASFTKAQSQRGDATGAMSRAAQAARPPTATEIALAIARNPAALAKITIDISGAPKGTRTSIDPKSTADVDLATGFQTLFGGT